MRIIWSKIISLCVLLTAAGIIPQLYAAPGCSAQLQWNASPSPGVAGYAVYYGVSGSSVTNRVDAGLSDSCTITGLTPSTTYFFYVVAYDSYGDESPPSNVTLYTTPPISPLQISQSNGVVNLQFLVAPGAACEVEYTPTLSPPAWTVLTNAVGDSNGLVNLTELANGPQGFYRAVIPTVFAPQVSAKVGLPIVLQWSPSPSPGTAGYTVYYGVSGSSVTNQINVSAGSSLNVTNLLPATTYFFSVVAYNSSGVQSAPSNPSLLTTPPISPLQITQLNGAVNLQFQVSPGAACHVEYTTTLNPPVWTVLTNVVADTNGQVTVTDVVNGPQRFYRGALGTGILAALQPVLPMPALSYTLQWQAGLDPGALSYVVSYAASGSSATNQIDVGDAPSTTITGLLPSTTYVFSVSGIDVLGIVSVPLDVVTYTTPPISPLEIGQLSGGAIQIEFLASPGAPCHVEYTTSLNPPVWTVLTNTVASTNGLVTVTDIVNGPQKFYRGALGQNLATPSISP